MSDLNVELLAPAGSMEAFLGAIHAGADAVYLAGNKYGARAYADNFSEEELLFCIRYAHIWGRKVYLTINTLFKEWELQDLYSYMCPLYNAGLDACIIQDLGVFQYVKQYFPEMELHVSTQMTITGAYGALLLKELGASRIVPARELSLAEIQHMKSVTGLEMETFIHGAMCYCYSGQCLFSSILGGRSGNRGKCAQPCRLPYSVNVEGKKKEACFPLSLKDMCTLEHMDALIDAGIDSFKIEGRMKKPEYAAGVTAIYRKYIDRKKKEPQKRISIDNRDLEKLSKLYIRSQRQDGYYFKHNGGDMVTLDNPAYNGSDEALIKEIRAKYITAKPKMPITIFVSMVCGSNAEITMLYKEHCITVQGEEVTEAQKQPVTEENIVKQVSKLGDTCFEAEMVQVNTDGKAFYSLKALNELRRQAILELENQIIVGNGLVVIREAMDADWDKKLADKFDETIEEKKGWTIQISTMDQLKVVERLFLDGEIKPEKVYVESELLLSENWNTIISSELIYVALPYCMRQKDIPILDKLIAIIKQQGYNGCLVRNIEEYGYLKKIGYEGAVIGDASLYVWNSYSKFFWRDRMDGLTCPVELNKKEYTRLFDDISYEKVVYGRLPMMITANCVKKTMGKCTGEKSEEYAVLTDRYQKKFPVKQNCAYCYNIVYNSVPLSLHKELEKGVEYPMKRLVFTVENAEETKVVLNYYKSLSEGETTELPFYEFTTGHEKRGVE